MLINFPFVKMPLEFCEILQTNFGNLKDPHQFILEQFSKNYSLRMMLSGRFKVVKDSMNLEQIYKSFGWKLFRDQITAIYLYRYEYEQYPISIDIVELDKIVDFEEKFYPYALLHDSRSFLLGFYLKMAEITYWKDSGGARVNLIDFATQTYELISEGRGKNPKIDYLILGLWHFLEYFGKEDLYRMIKEQKQTYSQIYNKLDEKYQKVMTSNFLTYGMSIQDHGLFFEHIPNKSNSDEHIVL